MWIVSLLVLIVSVNADVYLHNPRGSNNRLDGDRRDRNNANRMFDSQNNNRGGYNVGSLYYHAGSELPIEWTNQHSCGEENADCQLVIQYMCDDQLRDGNTEGTIPEHNSRCKNNDCNSDMKYGMNENLDWYNNCKYRLRNRGLFTADQRLRGHTARYTRQNPNGQRRGLECPEERDYYPYWHPTQWKDIVIMTNDVNRCAEFQTESQNVKEKYSCVPPAGYMKALINNDHKKLPWHLRKNLPINKEECETIIFPVNENLTLNAKWTKTNPWGLPPPKCIKAPKSRDNHIGNGIGGFANLFNWTIPNLPHKHCALRMRYNISTTDFDIKADASMIGNEAAWPYEFRFHQAGPLRHYDCIKIEEKKDPHTWHDNYFCARQHDRSSPGMKWSSEGPIAGMRCTQITEPSDPDGWDNNYLCIPETSRLYFKWSSSGPIYNLPCVRWYEAADRRNGWGDNYLCAETKPVEIVSGPFELGYCVKSNNQDQNKHVARIDRNSNYTVPAAREECMKKCLQYGQATACEVVFDGRYNGCYVHHAEVARGNGINGYGCYVFKNPFGTSKIDIASLVGISTRFEAISRGYLYKTNPTIQPLAGDVGKKLQLQVAINTAQYGRTFQDRSHDFEIRARPTSLAGEKIHNINVRGKRGNIVQVYPAVEYDFTPNRQEAKVGDYIHLQWTGSNTNPHNNAGQGLRGSDRSNVVLLEKQAYPEGTPGKAVQIGLKNGHWGRSYPKHLDEVDFLGLSKNDLVNLAILSPGQFRGELSELDDAGTYNDLPPRRINNAGTFHYMCSRNNNFSNRSQKGKIVVAEA